MVTKFYVFIIKIDSLWTIKQGENSLMNRQRQIMFEQIGAKVAYYRRLTGFSQAELAEKIHVNKSVLSRIERGKYNDNIPLILLLDIADIMQVDVATFITFNDFERRFWDTERNK